MYNANDEGNSCIGCYKDGGEYVAENAEFLCREHYGVDLDLSLAKGGAAAQTLNGMGMWAGIVGAAVVVTAGRRGW